MSTVVGSVIKAASDKREFRSIVLANGIRGLLVQDKVSRWLQLNTT
jgi:secreted Zn-dependent insulinase-like peptidase